MRRREWGDKELIQCIAFSQTPAGEYSGFLEFLQSQGIEVVWDTDTGISGHPESVEKLRRNG